MSKSLKNTAGILTILLVCLLSSNPASAQLNLNMNEVDIFDTVYTCQSVYGMFLYPDSRITQDSKWIFSKFENGEFIDEDIIYGDTISYFEPFDEGSVTQQGSDGISTYEKSIEVRPLVLNTGYSSGGCGTPMQLHASTNYSGDGNVDYRWEPAEYLDDPDVADPTAVVFGSEEFTVTLITPTGCLMIKTIDGIVGAPEAPSICMVSVDSATNKNIIYWEMPSSNAIDSVFLYRETNITNNYIRIGQIAVDNPGFIIDTSSYPQIQSNKYRIAVTDSCGNASEYSEPHKTIHLTINQSQNNSWNLIWEPYQGFVVATYRIYRGSTGGEMELIGTTSGSSTQYTDFSAPNGYVRYQVATINPSPCNIMGLKTTQTIINESSSNIASNQPTSIATPHLYNSYAVYPNPFGTVLHIESVLKNRRSIVELTGLDGKKIKTFHIDSDTFDIDGSNLKSGTYILNIKSGNDSNSYIVVKE